MPKVIMLQLILNISVFTMLKTPGKMSVILNYKPTQSQG